MAENLTSLANARKWLNASDSVTTDDVLISRLIAGASRFILNHLNRRSILWRPYADVYNGHGGTRLILRNWPVTAITSLSIDGVAVDVRTSPTAAGYAFDAWDGFGPGRHAELNLVGRAFTRAHSNVAVGYDAGYRIAGEAATIPATPYEVTVEAPQGSFAADIGVTLAGVAMTKVASGTPTTGQYKVDAAGKYTFAAANTGSAVAISYSFIPADIENACFELVGEQYRAKDRIGQVSQSMGGQTTASYSQKAMSEIVKAMLLPYRNVLPI